MVQYLRLSALLLGVWLGASVLADIAVTQNFQTVDRFLDSQPPTGIGQDQARAMLRRNAAEENNWIFTNWERAEFVLAFSLAGLFLAGGRSQKLLLAGAMSLIVILAAERFFLTPRIVDMGRFVEGLAKTDGRYKTFWMLHGIYSGLDILKMLVIFGLAARVHGARGRERHRSAPRNTRCHIPAGCWPKDKNNLDKRRMCPNCRAFITTADRTCPYCGQTVGARRSTFASRVKFSAA